MHAVILISLLLLGGGFAMFPQAQEAEKPPLEELLSRNHYRDFNEKDKYKDRIDILRKAMEGWASALRRHLDDRNLEELKAVLAKIRAIARYAMEEPTRASASSKDLRSKQIKKMEILLRRQLDSFNDMRLSVPFDFRVEFEITTQTLEELRDQLLRGLFYQQPSKSQN